MPLQTYEFVSVSGLDRKTYTSRVRAHVLRRYYQKKGDPKAGGRRPPSRQYPPRTGLVLSPSKELDTMYLVDKTVPNQPPNQPLHFHRQVPSLSHVFSTVTVSMSARQRYLVHHFITVPSSPLYELDSIDVKFDPARDICFREMMDEDVGMIALTTCAAYDLARLSVGQLNTEAVQLEVTSIRLLNRRLSNAQLCADDMSVILVLVFIAGACELMMPVRAITKLSPSPSLILDLQGDPVLTRSVGNQNSGVETLRTLRLHIEGLRKMVRCRGGFAAFGSNSRVGWHVHWYDIVNAGEISAGLSPFSHFLGYTLSGDLSPQPRHPPVDSERFAHLAASELIGYYSAIYDLAVYRPSPALAMIRRLLLVVFPRTSPVFVALHAPCPESSLALSAVLIYLGATVWDLCEYYDGAVIGPFFRRLQTFVLQQGLHRSASLHVVLWVLMTDMDTFRLQCPERLWLVAHCLWVMKRLSVECERRLQRALLGFLFELGTDQPSWQPHEMAQEVWQSRVRVCEEYVG